MDAETANFWIETCQEDGPGRQLCIAFIRGLNDMNFLYKVTMNAPFWCLPEGATLDQMRRVILTDLLKRPENNHAPFTPQAAMALRKAFPCKYKKGK